VFRVRGIKSEIQHRRNWRNFRCRITPKIKCRHRNIESRYQKLRVDIKNWMLTLEYWVSTLKGC